MAKFKINLKVEIRDKNGKLVRTKTKNVSAKSYVKAMMDILYIHMGYTTLAGVVDVAGTSRTIAVRDSDFTIKCPANSSAYGIVVGSGNNSVLISDTKLSAQIVHGVAEGQLQHGAVSAIAPTTVGSTRQFTASRTFTNGSGADITVKEVGLYISGYDTTTRYFCGERSLLEFVIANGESGTVTYTISVTV